MNVETEQRKTTLFLTVIFFAAALILEIFIDQNIGNKLVYGILFIVCLIFLYIENTKTASVKGAGVELKLEAQERNNHQLEDKLKLSERKNTQLTQKIEELEKEIIIAKEKITELETKLKDEELKGINPNTRSIDKRVSGIRTKW